MTGGWLDSRPARRKVLLSLEGGHLPGGVRSLKLPSLFVGSTDRIGIVGVNGSGKSTLIERIVAVLSDDIEIVYIPQEVDEEVTGNLVEKVKYLDSSHLGRLLSIMARLNSSPERILDGTTVSPGELRKLMLAEGALRNPVLIIMDEPTNHLDIHSVEALQGMLTGFTGALLLVSHDKTFIEETTSTRWAIGCIEPGGFELSVWTDGQT